MRNHTEQDKMTRDSLTKKSKSSEKILFSVISEAQNVSQKLLSLLFFLLFNYINVKYVRRKMKYISDISSNFYGSQVI